MKIITVNLRKPLAITRVLLKMICFLLILITALNLSSFYFEGSDEYSETAIMLANQKTIIIDAGHGGEDCGAIGTNGVYEKDLNLSVAMTIGDEFAKSGYAVIYTRLDDKLLYTADENI